MKAFPLYGGLALLVAASLACQSLTAPAPTPTLPAPHVTVWAATPRRAFTPAPEQTRAVSATPLASEPTLAPLPVATIPDPTLAPGEYLSQPGDTLPALVARFRAITDEVLSLNPNLPLTQTLAPGLRLRFSTAGYPAHAFAQRLLPDDALVRSPSGAAFDVQAFVLARPGWLATYTETLKGETTPRTGWDLVTRYARSYSINPRLLLALLEYQSGALSQPTPRSTYLADYPLGAYSPQMERGLSHQLGWAGNQLNYGYYGWRDGSLLNFGLADGAFRTVDPAQNAGTFAVVRLLGLLLNTNAWNQALKPAGFMTTYQNLFGDPWRAALEMAPGGLTQPPLQLPFEPEKLWVLSGGPHPPYGRTLPLGALDFAPASEETGCAPSPAWAVAVREGSVTYSDDGRVELDVGGGWEVIYLHIATQDRVPLGAKLNAGERVGHPSCEGGNATGSHVHLSRRYLGEWIAADGPAPFVLSGWLAHFGPRPYQGTLTLGDQTVTACPCANVESRIQLGP